MNIMLRNSIFIAYVDHNEEDEQTKQIIKILQQVSKNY